MAAANPTTPTVKSPKPTPASIRAQRNGERRPPPAKPKKPFRPFLGYGRPTVLSREMIEEVARLMPTVLYLETIGDYLGVHRTTWRKWRKRGDELAGRLADDPGYQINRNEELYVDFFYTCRRGMAEAALHDQSIIAAGAPGWQTAAGRQARWYRALWGARRRPKWWE
jgi:hypothetical protein